MAHALVILPSLLWYERVPYMLGALMSDDTAKVLRFYLLRRGTSDRPVVYDMNQRCVECVFSVLVHHNPKHVAALHPHIGAIFWKAVATFNKSSFNPLEAASALLSSTDRQHVDVSLLVLPPASDCVETDWMTLGVRVADATDEEYVTMFETWKSAVEGDKWGCFEKEGVSARPACWPITASDERCELLNSRGRLADAIACFLDRDATQWKIAPNYILQCVALTQNVVEDEDESEEDDTAPSSLPVVETKLSPADHQNNGGVPPIPKKPLGLSNSKLKDNSSSGEDESDDDEDDDDEGDEGSDSAEGDDDPDVDGDEDEDDEDDEDEEDEDEKDTLKKKGGSVDAKPLPPAKRARNNDATPKIQTLLKATNFAVAPPQPSGKTPAPHLPANSAPKGGVHACIEKVAGSVMKKLGTTLRSSLQKKGTFLGASPASVKAVEVVRADTISHIKNLVDNPTPIPPHVAAAYEKLLCLVETLTEAIDVASVPPSAKTDVRYLDVAALSTKMLSDVMPQVKTLQGILSDASILTSSILGSGSGGVLKITEELARVHRLAVE
jgi:hypothetical protein